MHGGRSYGLKGVEVYQCCDEGKEEKEALCERKEEDVGDRSRSVERKGEREMKRRNWEAGSWLKNREGLGKKK